MVGTRTGGAVMAGRASVLSDGSLLLVAVTGGTTDGVNLEGHGVKPTGGGTLPRQVHRGS